MPDRDKWARRFTDDTPPRRHPRRSALADDTTQHITRGHYRVREIKRDGTATYHCASCNTPWPCDAIATRMQIPLTADELTELGRRIHTRDTDPTRLDNGQIAWDTALEIWCAYQALDRAYRQLREEAS